MEGRVSVTYGGVCSRARVHRLLALREKVSTKAVHLEILTVFDAALVSDTVFYKCSNQ